MTVFVVAAVFASKPFFARPFLLGAHRGGVRTVPENTVQAFADTAKRYPHILFHTDVRTTKDGELVLLHDETVDRTTNGHGKIANLTLSEARRLDAGYRFSIDGKRFPFRGKGVRIATLEEALEAAPAHRFELDIRSLIAADKVADLIIRKGAVDRVLFASPVPAAMERVRERLPGAAVSYDSSNGARLLAAVRGNSWDAYFPEADVLSMGREQVVQFRISEKEIRRIRAKGIRFQIHTLNEPTEVQRWLRVGVDSILTDRPDVLAYEAVGKPMTRAHAHNDYEHPRPLLDALDLGFASVEADIFLVDGEIRVGHDRKSLRPGRTLEALYLDPLLARVRRHGGTVHPWPGEFTLLVDIKADGERVVAELTKRLARYREMLTSYDAIDGVRPLAVTVVLSGNRPIGTVAKVRWRQLFLDGRLSDLGESGLSTSLYPLISDSYPGIFSWNGQGQMPDDQRSKLRELSAKVHAGGQRFRLWAVPDTEDAWREMDRAGVDLINTDRLEELANYLSRPRI